MPEVAQWSLCHTSDGLSAPLRRDLLLEAPAGPPCRAAGCSPSRPTKHAQRSLRLLFDPVKHIKNFVRDFAVLAVL
jgi:hypothetical protein